MWVDEEEGARAAVEPLPEDAVKLSLET